jgi:hypothetical protein
MTGNRGRNIQISPEATSSDREDYADIHVVQLTNILSVLLCYTNNTSINGTSSIKDNSTLPADLPLSPITSIVIQNTNGTQVSVTNLTQPIIFSNIIPQTVSTLASFASMSCPRRPVSHQNACCGDSSS